jgi:response regulator RpfG family c-di-GMP phosphodiesterase
VNITLLIEKNRELALFYKLILRTWVNIDAKHMSSAKEASEFINSKGVVDLIIIRESHKTKKIHDELLKFYPDKSLDKVPTIILGEDLASKNPLLTYVSNGLNHKELIKSCANSLEITAKDMVELELPEFFPIKSYYLKYLDSAPCDLFTIPKNIITKKGDQVDEKTEEKLGDGTDFYVNKNERLEIVKAITNAIIAQIDPSILTQNETITYSEMTFNNLAEQMTNFGMTEESIETSKKAMKTMVTTAKNNPSMNKLVARLIKNNTGYLFKHTQVLMFITTHLMENIDWGSDDQKDKIHFVSFFHDIALTTSEQAIIRSDKELKASDLEPKEKELVNKHAQIAAELVGKFPQAPMGVDIIIRQHHGVAHGIGFSEHYSGNISPLAIVFILAEDFTRSLLTLNEMFNTQRKIEEMRKTYKTQRFSKIIDVLEKII